MATETTDTKRKAYGGLAVVAVIFLAFLWPHSTTYDGDGTINAFPSSDSVKNYRLDATMDVEAKWKGWFGAKHYKYSNIVGAWPDGGSLELDDCIVTGTKQVSCADQDGKEYGIEVVTDPDIPEYDPPYDN